MNKNDSNEFKCGQQVWLYKDANLETWFLGKSDKTVLLSTPEETPSTLYRTQGTATLFHDQASAIQSRVEILISEVRERETELQALRYALKVAQESSQPTPPRASRLHCDEGPGL